MNQKFNWIRIEKFGDREKANPKKNEPIMSLLCK